MAERFITLGHWVTLGDDALNEAIREVGIAHPGTSQAKRPASLCQCAGDPGRVRFKRLRAVYTAVAVVSVRTVYRHASPCSTIAIRTR
jgi:ATP-dependent helicase/nuclease subunit A